MRLIDADLLMRKCEKWLKPKAPDEDEMVSVADIAVSTLMEIEEQPTVNASASMPYQTVTRWLSVNLVSTRRDL